MQTNIIDLLCEFVDSRPGLDPRDYISGWNDINGRRIYNRERAEITRDRSDFYEILNVLFRVIDSNEIEQRLTEYLKSNNDRLVLKDSGQLEYHCGQYYPTEYRPAASRCLVTVLWNYLQKDSETGHEIRNKAKKLFSRRVYRNYFN